MEKKLIKLQMVADLKAYQLAMVMAGEHSKMLKISLIEFRDQFGQPIEVVPISEDKVVIKYLEKGWYLYDVTENKMKIKKVEVEKDVDNSRGNEKNSR